VYKILFVIAVAALVSACQSQDEIDYNSKTNTAATEAAVRRIKRLEDEAEQSGQNCLKRGGVIVRSAWDSRILECK
jgi:hypothetical protein